MRKTFEKVYKNTGNAELLELVPNDARDVLDVGCGSGDNAKILQAVGMNVDGITLSKDEAAVASRYLRSVYVHNLEIGLPSEIICKYDAIIMSHVLEHIAYPDKLLADVRSVIQVNGRLIVAVPNIMHYKSRLRLLFGSFEYEEAGVWDNTHLRWYTIRSIVSLLEKNGFHVHKVDVSGDVPAASVVRRAVPQSMLPHIFNFFKFISKGLFGYQILVIASAKGART